MILTECPSQKDISWCPKMDFCMILYETFFGRVIKSLMKSNHQLFQCWLIINLTHKKKICELQILSKIELAERLHRFTLQRISFRRKCLLHTLQWFGFSAVWVKRCIQTFLCCCLSHSLQWHSFAAWMTRCERISNFCENCWSHTLKWRGFSRVSKRIKTNKNTGFGITTHPVWKKY